MTNRADVRLGIAVLVVIAVAGVLVFWGLPGGGGYRLDAVISSANQLRAGTPVRLGGLDVGKVESIEAGPGRTATVRLGIDERADSIRTDAALAVVPRLALEGNAYLRLSPGTPGAPPMPEGGTIPLERTSVAVQLDQVTRELTAMVRRSLRSTLDTFATGLDGKRSATGADGLRSAARELDGALHSVRRAARGIQGTVPGDLARASGSTGDFAAQLAKDPRALASLITSYDRSFATLANRDRELTESVRALQRLAERAPRRLASIENALPPLQRFARRLEPALRVAPPALTAGAGAADQLDKLVDRRELGGLLADIDPATRALPATVRRLRPLAARLEPVGACFVRNVIPTLNAKVPDGSRTTGQPVWHEVLHMASVLASFSNQFDGNGTALRAGTQLSETGLVAQLPNGTPIQGFGDITGVAPRTLPGGPADLQFRPDAPCTEQTLPDLGARRSEGLPSGLRRVPLPRVPSPGVALATAMADRDVAGVMRALRRLVPGLPVAAPKRRAAPRPSRAPHGRAPVDRRSPAQSLERRLGDLVRPGPVVDGVLDAVRRVIDPLRKQR